MCNINMVRPDWGEFISSIEGYIMCNCGSILHTRQQTREHWQMGHFDYVEKEDKVLPCPSDKVL